TTDIVKETDRHRKQFEQFATQANQPSWLLPLRQAGISTFAELGFPTLKDEDWRFTNVAPIAQQQFQPVLETDGNASPALLEKLPFAKLPGSRIVFVNGIHVPTLSILAKLPNGVKVGNLASILASRPAFLEKYFAQYAPATRDAFVALNQAFFLDGGFVYVPSG